MDKAQIKAFIAARVAKELKDGDVVNLGIGLPTLVPAYLPENVHVILQSENGTIGTGPVTDENRDPFHVVDAGGSPSAAAPGACFIDSASSFALIRGGHVDATILGGLEVDEEGSLANWIIPGKKMPGMGGAVRKAGGALHPHPGTSVPDHLRGAEGEEPLLHVRQNAPGGAESGNSGQGLQQAGAGTSL